MVIKHIVKKEVMNFRAIKHIFECSKQNKEESKLKYEDILNGSLQMKIISLKKFQEKFNERKTTLGFSSTC